MPSEIPEIRYLTVLRVIASFAVVVLHVSGFFVSSMGIGNKIGWWIANFMDSSVRWCVPVFVLISGALLLDPTKTESLNNFFIKRSKRIVIPLIFWSSFYFSARALFGQHGIPFKVIVHDIIYGIPYYHLWYLYMILGLYLFTPCLRAYVNSSTQKERLITLISIFVISSIYDIFIGLPGIIIAIFLPYIGYFICGYHLRIMDYKKLSMRCLLIIFFSSIVVIAIVTGFLTINIETKKSYLLYNYFSPPVIIMSISLFIILSNLKEINNPINSKINNIINKLSPTTFGIYVIHPIIIDIFTRLINKDTIFSRPLIFITIISILTFLISTIITLIIIKIPYLRRTVI